MRPRHRRLRTAAGLVVVALVVVPGALAGAYSHDSTAGASNADWMAGLSDSLNLSRLSLPGTHDSGASLGIPGGEPGDPIIDSVLAQSMSIGEQLNEGIRAFDIRLDNRYIFGAGVCQAPDLWVGHGPFCQGQRFDQVLTTMNQFLTDHPSEAVLMRIRQERDPATGVDFADKVQEYLNALPAGRIYDGSGSNPTLDQIRGKIVILRDYSDSSVGIRWGSLDRQDEFSQPDNWHLKDKWDAVRDQFGAANTGSSGVAYVNFLSASGGGFPYFFASGKSSPGTNAPALLTGWTRGIIDTCAGDSRCIGEYPSVNCFLGTCSVAFKGIDYLASDYLSAHSELTRVGIVYADFPGADLIDAIIDVNFGLDVSPPSAPLIMLPPTNGSGWYNSDVSVTWNWTDGSRGSGIDPANCPAKSTSLGEGDAVVVTATCKDLAGNQGTASVTLQIDKTRPTVGADTTSASNANGWYNHDVTVHFTCNDTLSGIPADACPVDQVLSSEGAVVASTAETVTDVAGNTSDPSNVVTVAIDKTPPTVSVENVRPGAQYLPGAVPVATCSTNDGLSRVATPASVTVTTTGANGVGSFTATCSGAIDNADNAAAPVSVSYTVVYGFGGFLSPFSKSKSTFKAGSTIPVKFVLADASGNPIPASIAAALAAAGAITATLTGQGIDPVSTPCIWDSVASAFHCNLKTPTVHKLGTDYPYSITVAENLTGTFVTSPGVGGAVNPEEVFFK